METKESKNTFNLSARFANFTRSLSTEFNDRVDKIKEKVKESQIPFRTFFTRSTISSVDPTPTTKLVEETTPTEKQSEIVDKESIIIATKIAASEEPIQESTEMTITEDPKKEEAPNDCDSYIKIWLNLLGKEIKKFSLSICKFFRMIFTVETIE